VGGTWNRKRGEADVLGKLKVKSNTTQEREDKKDEGIYICSCGGRRSSE